MISFSITVAEIICVLSEATSSRTLSRFLNARLICCSAGKVKSSDMPIAQTKSLKAEPQDRVGTNPATRSISTI
ncbi:uncharacterized protein METZ01_LOCUS391824, partial [marine metagenome]